MATTANRRWTNVSVPNAVSAAVASACCHVLVYRLKNAPNPSARPEFPVTFGIGGGILASLAVPFPPAASSCFGP